MYLVANIDEKICGATACTLCTQYCPEANCIQYDRVGKTAYVAVDRCKGCMQCVWVCDTMAKHHAIKMVMIDQLPAQYNITSDKCSYEQEQLKPAAVNR